MIILFERGVLLALLGTAGGLSVGELIMGSGSCSRDMLGDTTGEAAGEAIDDESDSIEVLIDVSLSIVSSELSSALSARLSVSTGIRLCLVTLGARRESLMGSGSANAAASPEWSMKDGFREGNGLAVDGGDSGDSGAVVEIKGMGIPP